MGRPIIISDKTGLLQLGRASRVKVAGSDNAITASVQTDSYIASEVIFIPSSLTVQLVSGEAYAVTIPQAVGGRPPITYALDGALPNGATGFDEDTRMLSRHRAGGHVTQTADFEATDSTTVVYHDRMGHYTESWERGRIWAIGFLGRLQD